MQIKRLQGIIQMYTEDPEFWCLHCTLQKSLVYYLNPSNTAISCHSENKLWPPVLHLFVMAHLQGGMIYLKIRTSSKTHEVLSTFQLKNTVGWHEQDLSPYRCVVKLGIVQLSLCPLEHREGTWIWWSPWKNRGMMSSTTEMGRIAHQSGHNMAFSTPNARKPGLIR